MDIVPKGLRKKVHIGDNVSIGQYTTIMPGAVIGNNVIVGANSLVIKNQVLEAKFIYLGVPVRKLRSNVAAEESAAPIKANDFSKDLLG